MTRKELTPRGIRNNNPLNIERGAQWVGLAHATEMTPEQKGETRFAVFVAPEFGIRAAARLLRTYQKKYTLVTVEQMIHRWAPPVENDTRSYARVVAQHMGIPSDKPFAFAGELAERMVEAMVRHENGQQPYPRDVFVKGIQLANLEV